MPKKNILIAILLAGLVLSACGKKAAVTEESAAAEITATPDPCSEASLPDEAAKVHKLTREFDDYSALATNTAQAQLVLVIPDMQRVLRDAEDQSVPLCLKVLKNLQLAHMRTVIQTLLGFMNASDAATMDQVSAGIAQARTLHGQYDVELAHLLGITLVAPPTLTPEPATPVVNVVPSPTDSGIIVTNPGPARVNLRSAPDLAAIEVGLVEVQTSTMALGRSADNLWIQVQIPGQPGQPAWVYAILVQLSVPIDQLPVITP